MGEATNLNSTIQQKETSSLHVLYVPCWNDGRLQNII